MSLVITSNIPKDEELRPDTSNTFKPYSYQNALLNTMKIPPMSEIALESCKITKNGLLSISAENSAFSAFFGPQPTVNLDSNTTQPTFGVSGPEDAFVAGGRVERNPTDFSRDITTGLGSAVYHPALVTGLGTSGVVCSVETDPATNDFKGFRWTTTQNISNTTKSTLFTYEDITSDKSGNFTVSADTRTLTATTAAGFYVQNRQQSISQLNGEVVIDFAGATPPGPGFKAGLSRINTDKGYAAGHIPETYNVRRNEGQQFEGVVSEGGLFFDICIASVGGHLRVYQVQTASNVGNIANLPTDLVMTEIVYHGATFGVAPFNTASAIRFADHPEFQKVKFKLTNEHVTIQLWNNDTSKWVLLVDNILTKAAGGTNANHNLTLPRTASQWNMYPTMFCRSIGAKLTLESVDHYAVQPPYDPLTYTKYNWWGNLEASGLERWASRIDTRAWNDFSNATEIVPKQLNIDKSMQDYDFQIVMMPSDVFGRIITQGVNTSQIFGFKNQSVAFPIPANANKTIQFFVSNNVPEIVSTSSLFVRLNNFTQQSVNARQGTISKIIAHLPRFDNAGNETGGLFFQPGERTYVALNNPDTLFINSFDVDYVYDNETLCKAISGKSITVFHIRKALV